MVAYQSRCSRALQTEGSATVRLGVRDFEIRWISRGFRISDWISVFHVDFWISGFQSGFLDFKVDFKISKWIWELWVGPGACIWSMHEQIRMQDILHTSPRKMTFVPDKGYKGHFCAVM